jgi:hypothetical protein
MNSAEKLTKKYLSKKYPRYNFAVKLPQWLKGYRWKPRFLLINKNEGKILAVDMILSGLIPKYQYIKIVKELLKDHRNLRVIAVTFEEHHEDNPEIEKFCKKYRIGLKIIVPSIGLHTILRTDFDSGLEKRRLPLEVGWFPLAILQNAKNLEKLGFHHIIDDFIRKVVSLGNDEKKTLSLVLKTIDKILSYHPSFIGQFGQFMKLSNFEYLLRLSHANSSEHVFHSFRVFLAGCSVINEFYSKFTKAQLPFCKMDKKKLRIEYAWLLTSIFHDIGRRKEAMPQFVSEQLDDEDMEVFIHSSDARWTKEHNITARRVLGSLGAFIVNAKEGEEWDGGIIEGEDSTKFTAEWIRIYDKMSSHGVISAFDFLGDLFKKAMAADERRHRAFIITHAATSAISMLLHDWKIWPEMRNMKLIPVNVLMLPMAALLIYIDTWDNYKRRNEDPLTYIKEYSVDSRGACVKVEWGDLDLMKKDEIGYIEYRKALKNLLFALDIKYGMAGDL